MARSLEVLGDPWSLLVLRELFGGATRFTELRDLLEVAETVLSDRLTKLCEAGLVEKVARSGSIRTRYTYHLTESGADTLPIFHALARWGMDHRTPESLKDTRLVTWCTTCGSELVESDWCQICQAPLSISTTAWRMSGRSDDILELARSAPANRR